MAFDPTAALAVDAQLLRTVLTSEINLSVGRSLMARVADLAPDGRGTLSLAGVLLEAELPDGVKAGQELRLQVREVTPERIVLGLQDPGTPPPSAAGAALPGGGFVRVAERDAAGGGGRQGAETGVHTLAITYDAPNLGAIDMQFALDPASLRLTVSLAAGVPYELADAAADGLRTALADALGADGRTVTVAVAPRYEPLDMYA